MIPGPARRQPIDDERMVEHSAMRAHRAVVWRRMVGCAVAVAAYLIAGVIAGGIQTVRAAHPDDCASAFLVRFAPHVPRAQRARVLVEADARMVRWLAPIHVAKVRMPQRTLPRLIAQRSVQWVEEDAAVVRGAYLPTDPAFQEPTELYAPTLIDLPGAWELGTGEPRVVIAVVDSGVDRQHVELHARLLPGWDFANDDDDPADDHGHGTHVAGLLAAAMDNGHGAAGVCPECRILPIKVLDENNLAAWSTVVEGLLYAVDSGAHVINVSLGGAQKSQTLAEAIDYAHEHDVLVVAAAGNGGSSESFYPAALDGVLAVGATDQQDTHWYLSNTGDYVDVVAPGHRIFSTALDPDDGADAYGYMTGTSMAAPHVAGVAGLLLSQDPTYGYVDLARMIIASAIDLGEPGWDPVFGHGRLDAHGALAALMPEQLESADDVPEGDASAGDRAARVHFFMPIAAHR